MARLGGFLVRPPRFFVSGVLDMEVPSVVVGVVLLPSTLVFPCATLGVPVVLSFVLFWLVPPFWVVEGTTTALESIGVVVVATDGVPTDVVVVAAADRAMDLLPRRVRW